MAALYKKDIKIFIILIPIINLANYFITYKNISFNTYFLLTLCIDTIQGFVTWLLVRYIIITMGEKYPLNNFTLKRLFNQIMATCLVGLLFIIVSTEVLNAIVKDTRVPLNFYQLDIWIYAIWIVVINGIYISLNYYTSWKNSEHKLQEATALKIDSINVKVGNKYIKILFSTIAGIYVDNGTTYLLDINSKSYIIDLSLDKLEQKLPLSMFFRVNRQYILHHNSIAAFNKIENKKIRITTRSENRLPNALVISRLKAPSFKSWFKQNSVIL